MALRVAGLVALLTTAACRMPNPAFDDGAVDDVGDTNEPDSTSVGESGSDTDTTDTSMDTSEVTESESEDAIEPDMPSEECPLEFSKPFSPVFGAPEQFGGTCPSGADVHMQVIGAGPVEGLVVAWSCIGPDCTGCGPTEYTLGVAGLPEFSTPLLELVELEQKACISVQTGAFHEVDESTRCVYDSMWVGDGDHFMLAVRQPSPLPPAGVELIGGKPLPAPGAVHETCSCTSLFAAGDPNLDCCVESMTEPSVTSLSFLDADVLPGEVGGVVLDSSEFTYHVAQAQVLPNCDWQNDVAMHSWAVVRSQ